MGSSLLGSARHASIAVDRLQIAEVGYWRTPISPSTILDLRQIAKALIDQQIGNDMSASRLESTVAQPRGISVAMRV